MNPAAVAVYLPLVLSFFTQKHFLGRRTTCHTQLFYRPDMTGRGSSSAVFSCDEPNTAPLAESFPFYAELQTGASNGVFSHKVKLFSAVRTSPSMWQRSYYRVNTTSLILETTQDSSNATVFTMVTEPNSDLHSPGGRFHLEYNSSTTTRVNHSTNHGCLNDSPSSSSAAAGGGGGGRPLLKLCATLAEGMNYCGPHNLIAAESCSQSGQRVVTGLLTPFYRFPMKQCKRFADLD